MRIQFANVPEPVGNEQEEANNDRCKSQIRIKTVADPQDHDRNDRKERNAREYGCACIWLTTISNMNDVAVGALGGQHEKCEHNRGDNDDYVLDHFLVMKSVGRITAAITEPRVML